MNLQDLSSIFFIFILVESIQLQIDPEYNLLLFFVMKNSNAEPCYSRRLENPTVCNPLQLFSKVSKNTVSADIQLKSNQTFLVTCLIFTAEITLSCHMFNLFC